MLALAIRSPALLIRMEEKARSCERKAIELESSDTDESKSIADV